MAGNIYDDALDALDEEQQGPQQDPIEAAADQLYAGRETRLRASMQTKGDAQPDRVAEAMKLSKETGLPVRLVEQNFDRVKREAENGRTPYEDIFAQTPALAEWASTPENAQLAADDMEQLGALEWLVSAPGRAFSQGINQLRFAQLRHESLFRDLTRTEQDLLDAYRFHMKDGGALGAGESWFKKAVTGGAQQLPNLFGAGLYAAQYGAAGAAATGAVGAGVGAVAGGVGAIPGALAAAPYGARAGALYGAAKFGFVVESGLALDEFLEFKDENGQTIDPAVARVAAMSAGAMAAGFEAIGFEAFAKTIPGLDKVTSVGARAAVKRALRQPTIRAALLEAATTYGKTLSIETATEVAQRGITIMAGELAKAATDPSMPRRTGSDIVEDLANEGLGALEGFGLLSAVGPTMGVARAERQIRQGEQATQFFKALGGQASASATVKRMPEAAQEFLERATKDGPIGTVYAPAETWVRYWQDQGVDPAAIAQDVTGSADALARALATGEDLAIPTARYAVTLAATEHNRYFAEELRLAPGEMNGREAKAFREQLQAEAAAEAEAASPTPPAGQQIREQVLTQLVEAGVEPRTAESYADLYESTFGNLAERAGVDATEFFEGLGLKIQRPAVEQVRQRAGAEPAPTATPTGEGSGTGSAPATLPLEGEDAPAFGDEVPGLAALEAAAAGATVEPVLGEGTEVNASGESSASLEAMSRLEGMKARGEQFGVFDRGGRFRPIIGADAVDYQPKRGETFGVAGPDGFRVLTDNGGRVVDKNLPATEDGGGDGRPGEAQGAGAGGDARAAGAQARGEGSGAAAAEPLGPYTNAERLGVYADVLDAARSLDPNVDERRLRAEFDHRLDLLDELRSIQSQESPVVLLREIAKRGGIYEDERGQAGEMRRLREGQAFGKVGGVPGVLAVKKRQLVNVKKKIDGKVEIRQERRGGLGLDVMLQDLQEDGRWPWLQDIEDLVEFINDVQINGIPEPLGAEFSTEDLRGVGIVADRDWWNDADRQAVDMLDVSEVDEAILEPYGPVDTSFNVAEFGQSLFDAIEEPGPGERLTKADRLDTGEEQPRLPGDVGDVREEERPTPKMSDIEDEFRLTSEVAKTKGFQGSLFQPAWHGSPHVFEKFSLHAIGSGEGAQAYGWGLYFASKREVAEHYRNYLSANTPMFEGLDPQEEASLPQDLKERVNDATRLKMPEIVKGAIDVAREVHVERLNEARVQFAELERRGDPSRWQDRSNIAFLERRIGIFDKIIAGGYKVSPRGRLFNVEIPDEGYLDWDKPASQQSPQVQEALKALGIEWQAFKPKTPKQWLRWADSKVFDRLWREDVGIRRSLNDGLRLAKDALASGDVSAFNRWQEQHQGYGGPGLVDPPGERIYEILKANIDRNARAGQTEMKPGWGSLGGQIPNVAKLASEALNAQGIVGIRYLDGMSRQSGEGAHNYVVFDDKLVEVREFFQSDVEGLTAESVADFAKQVKAQAGPDLIDFDLRFDGRSRNNVVTLVTISVRRGAARQGLGTRVMRELTRWADRTGARIELSPAERGYKPDDKSATTTSTGRLVDFYKRFGFVQNRGRNADYTTSAGMYREPTVVPGGAVERELAQPLFHGSPHDFENFSTEFIGTGEGAAAYGWGLYFASDPAIAAYYFDTLSGDPQILEMKIGTMRLSERNGWDYSSRASVNDVENLRASLAEDLLVDPLGLLAAGEAGFKEHVLAKIDQRIKDYEGVEDWPEGALAARKLRAELERPGALRISWDVKKGGIYQIEVSDSHIDAMLDWDAKLKDQTKAVQQVARETLKTLGYLGPKDNGPRQLTTAWKVYINEHAGMTDGDTGAVLYEAIQRAIVARAIGSVGPTVDMKKVRDVMAVDETTAKRASRLLWDAGVPGLKYLDANSRDGAEKVTRNIVVFDESIVTLTHKNGQKLTAKERREYFQTQDDARRVEPEGKRGAIRFGPGRQVSISLFEKADLTTFLHESGHLFLEAMGDLVERVKAVEEGQRSAKQNQLLADYATLLEWFGVDGRAGIQTPQHEQFAAAFEVYLGEGRAPSLGLQEAFSRFRAWILGVYRSLSRLNVRFTPEVRAVMDRLVASDIAIAQAQQDRAIPELFTTAKEAGMSEREFNLYRDTIAQANRSAREQLDRRLMAEVQREQTAQWKARRNEIENEVAAAVYEEPVYKALAGIQRGTNPDGSPLVEGLETEPLKLSKDILVQRYGAGALRQLPRPYIYTTEGGLDPNTVATMFGFDSGDAMLAAIADAAPMREVIRTRTEQRMLQEHGSLLLDGTLHDAAQTAIANEDRDAIIRAELRALGQLRRTVAPFQAQAAEDLAAERRERDYERRFLEAEARLRVAIAEGQKQVEIDQLKDEVANLKRKARGGAATINAALPRHEDIVNAAKARIASMKIRAIKPDVFWHASRRAGQQAVERAARQDFDGAIESKRKELLNLALYREAQRVREDVDARVKFARGLARPTTRAGIGLAGHNYLDQIDGILDRFEFAQVSQKALDRRASLIKFVEGLESAGLPADLPDEVLNEALRTNYQNLTVEQLVGVTDGLKAIVHLARLKNRLLKAAQQRELDETATEIADSIRANYKGTPATAGERDRRTTGERRRLVAEFFASHRKLASFAREMDGFQDGGPMWEAVIRPLNEAGAREAELNAQATAAFQKLVDESFPSGRDRRSLYEKVLVTSVGQSMSKMERLMVALNWGNEGNRDRLRRSERWSDEQVAGILATLTESDFRFVQGVFDLVNGYWSEIAAKQERVYGVAPEKVEATPIRTPFGEIAGGYFPLKYDERLSAKAGAFVDVEEAGLARAAAYAQATTKRGHTKARVQGVKLPVRRDFGVMFEHVRQVIHDLSHHETLIDVGRVLAHPAVQSAIYETHGDVVYRQLKNAVRDIAIGDVPATGAFEKAINHLRAGATIAGLGWNITTALLQPIGLTQSMVRIGPTWVARGVARWMRDAATMENTAAWVRERSTFMRERGRTQQREINEIRNAVGVNTGKFSGWVDDVLQTVTAGTVTKQGMADSYFFLIQQAQLIADLPTWLGQYEKALDAGADEATAVAQADQAVLDSQGGGQVKDLAAVQRGGPLMRLWTNFYSFFNTTFNLAAESTRRTNFRKPGDVGRLMVDYLLLYSVPAFIGYAVREAIRPDDDQDDDESLAEALAREQASYLMGTMMLSRELAGVVSGGYGYEGPAGARALSSASRLMKQVEQGEPDAAFWRSLNDTAGAVFHYPAGQVKRTVEGFAALVEGKTSNPFALISGAPK